jgi:hypothetical protein
MFLTFFSFCCCSCFVYSPVLLTVSSELIVTLISLTSRDAGGRTQCVHKASGKGHVTSEDGRHFSPDRGFVSFVFPKDKN